MDHVYLTVFIDYIQLAYKLFFQTQPSCQNVSLVEGKFMEDIKKQFGALQAIMQSLQTTIQDQQAKIENQEARIEDQQTKIKELKKEVDSSEHEGNNYISSTLPYIYGHKQMLILDIHVNKTMLVCLCV